MESTILTVEPQSVDQLRKQLREIAELIEERLEMAKDFADVKHIEETFISIHVANIGLQDAFKAADELLVPLHEIRKVDT